MKPIKTNEIKFHINKKKVSLFIWLIELEIFEYVLKSEAKEDVIIINSALDENKIQINTIDSD